jgi:HPt (histidine-containing phosphotransfer) domain-containing protein
MFHADAKPPNRGLPKSGDNPVPGERPSALGRESCVGCTQMSAAGAIDLPHLTRMTFGEKSLQAEVLALFDRQADMLLAHIMKEPSPKAAAAFAHTIRGSARGVGAWKVAAAAEAVELAAKDANPAGFAGALRRLAGAIGEARAAIRELRAAL